MPNCRPRRTTRGYSGRLASRCHPLLGGDGSTCAGGCLECKPRAEACPHGGSKPSLANNLAHVDYLHPEMRLPSGAEVKISERESAEEMLSPARGAVAGSTCSMVHVSWFWAHCSAQAGLTLRRLRLTRTDAQNRSRSHSDSKSAESAQKGSGVRTDFFASS